MPHLNAPIDIATPMSSGSSKRTRSQRVATLHRQSSRFEKLLDRSRHGRLWAQIGFAALAAAVMLVACTAWNPPFQYRPGTIPSRDLVSRVTFQVYDSAETELLRRQRRREVKCLYVNRPSQLSQLPLALKDKLFQVLSAPSLGQLSPEALKAWGEFFDGDETASPDSSGASKFAALHETLSDDMDLVQMEETVRSVLAPYVATGLLTGLEHSIEEGSQRVIAVYPDSDPETVLEVPVDSVRIAQAVPNIESALVEAFRENYESERATEAAKLVSSWLADHLPKTLSYDSERSELARAEAAASVPRVMTTYFAGVSKIATAGRPLGDIGQGRQPPLDLLQAEHAALVGQMSWQDHTARLLAYFGMLVALFLVVGTYIYFFQDRDLLKRPDELIRLLAVGTLAVVACQIASTTHWQLETIPVALTAIAVTVVYGRPLALVMVTSICLAVTLFSGQDLADFVSLGSAALSCIFLTGSIRTRQRLIYVGVGGAIVTFATVLGVGTAVAPTFATSNVTMIDSEVVQPLTLATLLRTLLSEATWYGSGVLLAGFLMTGLLPFIEKAFGVLTDISLLEMSDASHPLLRQLAQRAPGTYNHSINVASIAEAAAGEIGGNELLLRVGAYFHDIGKMFKPDYFIENQGQGPNQHSHLQPAMSTLVIIAHVKDGADLARSYHLPESIIDFIQQHHGTTLVEYFYREATRRSEEDPNGEPVSDQDFRYPGPKPQTLEAAILMLADGVESASRTLVDPTPSRISSLVESIAMKRLSDGQFDECGITLRQLDRVKKSLVKSLTAIYHARVKYPDQQTA